MIIYQDRTDAGEKLAQELKAYHGKDTVVVAIPRGGIMVAAPIVKKLGAALDLIIPRKVGTANDPEVAAGAITPDGTIIYNEQLLFRRQITTADLKPIIGKEMAELKRRDQVYRKDLRSKELAGKTVIVVDDGMATGLTVLASLQAVKNKRPARLILAVPVATKEAVELVSTTVDHVICLVTPEPFFAVGQFYYNFGQTTDEEVTSIIRKLDK